MMTFGYPIVKEQHITIIFVYHDQIMNVDMYVSYRQILQMIFSEMAKNISGQYCKANNFYGVLKS